MSGTKRATSSQTGKVEAATEAAVAAAGHLTDADKGAVEALRVLSRKIDTEDRLRGLALEWAAGHDQKPPAVDNVTIPTFLKFCDSLGLTPAGRSRMAEKKQEAKPVGTLALLQGQARRKAG